MVQPEGPQLEAFPLTDYLVGPFAHEAEVDTLNPAPPPYEGLQSWQVPFYRVAMDALRRMAGQEELSDEWTPTPVQGAELYRELAHDRKVHGMVTGLKEYIHDYKRGEIKTPLREDQQEMFDAINEALTGMLNEDQVTIKSATGTGKTAVMIKLVEALKYKEQPSDPAKVMLLVPTKDILGQTIKAIKRFAPDLDFGVYFGEHKEMRDVTLITYRSFDIAVRAGILTRDMVDVLIKDEEDESGGKKISESLAKIVDGETGDKRKILFGFSATPTEEENLAFERNILEAIDQGILSPISGVVRKTNATINEQPRFRKREDYAPEELEALIDNDPRNEIIIREVLSGLANGRRIAVRCLPGGELLHPNLLKDRLNATKTTIKDPYTGATSRRNIRSVVIDGNMPMHIRRLLYNVYNNPLRDGSEGIDVLLFVDTITRGFDSPILTKLINACPTRKRRKAEQLWGRLTRPFRRMDGSLQYGQAVDLEDESKQDQVLFRDVINRYAPPGMQYKEGALIGPGLCDPRPSRNNVSAFEPKPIVVEDTLEESTSTSRRPRSVLPSRSEWQGMAERDVADSIRDNPFDTATAVTAEELSDHVSIAEAAALGGVTTDIVEDAIIDRNLRLAVHQEPEGEPRYYLPPASYRRLQVYLRSQA